MNAYRDDDCEAVRAELAAHLYGETAGERADGIRAHLAACAACGTRWEELREARDLLDAWSPPGAEPLPAEDAREIARELVSRARRARRRATWRPLAAGVAAAVLVFAGLGAVGARVERTGGRLVVSFALPFATGPDGAGVTRGVPSTPEHWLDDVRSVARAELAEQASSLRELQELGLHELRVREEQERLKLARAIDRVRQHDREGLARLLGAVQQGATQQNRITREAILELAAHVDTDTDTDTE